MTSVDSDFEWLKKFLIYNTTSTHTVHHLENIKDLIHFGENKKWGFVLVDHKLGEERYINVQNLASKADIVAVHDAEIIHDSGYKYQEIGKINSYYKYICKMSMWHTDDKKDLYTSTLIMSNMIDITFLEDVFKKIKYDREVVACEYNTM